MNKSSVGKKFSLTSTKISPLKNETELSNRLAQTSGAFSHVDLADNSYLDSH